MQKTIHDRHKETHTDKGSTGLVRTPPRKGASKSNSNNSVVDKTNDTGDSASDTSLESGKDLNSSKEGSHSMALDKDEDSLSAANGG